LEITIEEMIFKIAGSLGYSSPISLDCEVFSNDFYVQKLLDTLPIIATSLPEDLALSGRTKISAKITGTLKDLQAGGYINIDKTEISYGKLFKKPETVPGNIKFKGRLQSKGTELESFILQLQNLVLAGNLSIPDFETMSLSGKFHTNKFNLSEWHDILPEFARLNINGSAKGNVTLSGSLERLNYNSLINIYRTSINPLDITKPIRNINATITITPKVAKIKNLSGKIDKSDFSGWVSVKNFRAPEIDFRLGFGELDITQMLELFESGESNAPQRISQNHAKHGPKSYKTVELLDRAAFLLPSTILLAEIQDLREPASLKPPAKKGKKSITKTRKDGNKEGFLAKLKARGNLTIQKGNYNAFRFSALSSHLTFQDKTLGLSKLRFNLYGGVYNGDLYLDLKEEEPVYRLNFTLKNVKTNDILSENTSLKNIIFSRMFADLQLQGSGIEKSKIAKSLTGKGKIELTDGEITTFNIVKKTALIAKLLGYPNIAKSVTNFNKMSGNFTIKKGIFTTPDLKMRSRDFDLNASGSFGLDSSLDYNCKIIFSQKISQNMIRKTSFAKYLANPSGRILLPFKVRGTITKPHFSVDENYIKDILKHKVKEKAKEKLEEGIQKALDKLFRR